MPSGATAYCDKTSPDDTICYAECDDCPSTSIELTTSPPAGKEYTILEQVLTLSLVYSKKYVDSL